MEIAMNEPQRNTTIQNLRKANKVLKAKNSLLQADLAKAEQTTAWNKSNHENTVRMLRKDLAISTERGKGLTEELVETVTWRNNVWESFSARLEEQEHSTARLKAEHNEWRERIITLNERHRDMAGIL
jgi:hypothetical protein